MSRLNTITTKVTRSPLRNVWTGILVTILLGIVMLSALSIFKGRSDGDDYYFTYLPQFEYKLQEGTPVPYASCASAGILNTNNDTRQMRSLADYSYLASLAYVKDDRIETELNQWFNSSSGESAVFEKTVVDNFKLKNITENKDIAVYKLITFPSEKEAIVTIRGSSDSIDWMVDAKMWLGALLMQWLRFFMPMGYIWTPMMHTLIDAMTILESNTANNFSYYKETTKFIQQLQESKDYKTIQITGHSLGGGVALISAAQTGVAGIGVSAPNAKLSRNKFGVSVEALNQRTFNIIPDFDIIPRADDVARNFQKIECRDPSKSFVWKMINCHSDGRRTLCELLYSCGTHNRPALCDCVTEFGFPQPTPKKGYENLSFAELCAPAYEQLEKSKE